MPVVQNVSSICRSGVVISYVAYVFFVSCSYGSAGLSYICMIARVAFELVDTSRVWIITFV